ncbi:MAG TPA: hypothetical protein VLI39_11460 [Sedimentisphaerales bacterium]|nr:hypothetical protein [Sedimentisphaerales bacterium]
MAYSLWKCHSVQTLVCVLVGIVAILFVGCFLLVQIVTSQQEQLREQARQVSQADSVTSVVPRDAGA